MSGATSSGQDDPSQTRLTRDNIPTLYPPREASVLLTVQLLLDYISHPELYEQVSSSVIYPSGGASRLRPRPEGMILGSLENLVQRIREFHEQKIDIDEWAYGKPEVRITDLKTGEAMAAVWMECKIAIGGKVVSEAVNSIVLHKEPEGDWKISVVADLASNVVLDDMPA